MTSAGAALGLLGLFGFYFRAVAFYTEFATTDSYAQQQAALDAYDGLVMTMVQLWLGVLGALLLVWVYQRAVYHSLMAQYRRAHDDADALTAGESLFEAFLSGKVPERQRALLELRKEGYEQLARPLERYIAVFVAFGIPAVVMGLGWCEAMSEPANLTVSCQHLCEMFLSVRTLATVCVYFGDPAARAQLLDWRELGVKLRKRVAGLAGRSSAGNRVRFHGRLTHHDPNPPVGWDGDGGGGGDGDGEAAEAYAGRGDGVRLLATADDDVRRMGSSAFAVLREIDDPDADPDDAARLPPSKSGAGYRPPRGAMRGARSAGAEAARAEAALREKQRRGFARPTHATLNPVFDSAAGGVGWRPSKMLAPVRSASRFEHDGRNRAAYSTTPKEDDRCATANPLFRPADAAPSPGP